MPVSVCAAVGAVAFNTAVATTTDVTPTSVAGQHMRRRPRGICRIGPGRRLHTGVCISGVRHAVGVWRGQHLPTPGRRLLQVYVRLLRLRCKSTTASESTASVKTATIDTPLASATVDPTAVAAVAPAVAPSTIASAIVATRSTTSVASCNAARILADAIG